MRTRQRVGVNLLWLIPGVVGGSEEYTLRTLGALADVDHDDLAIELFVTPATLHAHPDLANAFPVHVRDTPPAGRPGRVAVEATWLASVGATLGLGLWHHAGGTVPLGIGHRSPNISTCLTIHDVQPLVHPERFGVVKRRYLAAQLPRSAQRATVITTPSEHSRGEIIRLLGVAREKVHVVPHGIASTGEPSCSDCSTARAAYNVGDRYLIYPAKTFAHKNHTMIIDALAKTADPEVELVLTGGEGEAEQSVLDRIRRNGLRDRVHRLGRIPRADLDALIAGAAGVVMPSTYEGFGAPVLEAMVAGRPVLAADSTSLTELVGSAGRLLPPGDPAAWAHAMDDLLAEPDVAAELGRKGRERAREFTATASAEALLAAYRSTNHRREPRQ